MTTYLVASLMSEVSDISGRVVFERITSYYVLV